MGIATRECGCISFLIDKTPIIAKQIVVTKCFHSYCISCLKNWVIELNKPCPICKKNIFRTESGKDFTIIWKIFSKILQTDPIFVENSLEKIDISNDACPVCQEDLIDLGVVLSDRQIHLECCDFEKVSQVYRLYIPTIVQIVKEYKEKDIVLTQVLTPRPMNWWDKVKEFFRIYNPLKRLPNGY